MFDLDAPRRLAALAIVVVGLAASAGCGKDGGPSGAGGFQRPPTPVEAAEVTVEPVIDRFEAVGTIEAAEAITIVSEIPGIVIRLPFREGDHVDRNTVIAQLDDVELRAILARAEAILEQKHSAFDRIKLVAEQGAGTPQDLDNAAAELKVAESDVDLAKARLAKTRIVAPFAGQIGARRVSPGAFLQPGTPITELAQFTTIKVTFTAPERYVPALERGAPIRISTPAYPGESRAGTIDVIDPVLDPETRSVHVIARADNPDERFRPGMSANVSVILAQSDRAMTIPAEAVFAEGDQTLVYIVKSDSTVTRSPISLGLRLPGAVEVLAGLEPGQRVVRAGHQKLYEGARVMPISSRGAESPSEPDTAERVTD